MSAHCLRGGYPVDWFAKLPRDELICAICLDVLKNPHCCRNGHAFCLNCITSALQTYSKCPTCKCILSIDILMVGLCQRNLVAELNVKCQNESCDWTGPLHQKEKHETRCDHIQCPLFAAGCCAIAHCRGSVTHKQLLENHIFNFKCYTLDSNKPSNSHHVMLKDVQIVIGSISMRGFVTKTLDDGVVFSGTEPEVETGRHVGIFVDTTQPHVGILW